MTNKNSEFNLHIHESEKYSLPVTVEYQKRAEFSSIVVKNTSVVYFFTHLFSGYYDTSIHFVSEIGIIISRTALRSLLANLGYSQGSIRRGLESAHKF